MIKNARVSLGMPVYNGASFLEATLETILGQTFTDFELVISDNASTDSTADICKKIAAKDSRVTYFQNTKNLGAAPNYNRLVELTSGQYFKWVAHDDPLDPAYLQKCIEVLDQHPDIVVCYPSTIMIDETGADTGADPRDTLDVYAETPHARLNGYLDSSHRNRKCHAVFGVIRREALVKTALIGAYARSDFILLAELAILGKFKQLDEKLFFRLEHAQSSVLANPDLDDRDKWFDTSITKSTKLKQLFWFREYLRAIASSDFSAAEKLRCYMQLHVWLRRNRKHIYRELRGYVGQKLRRPPRLARPK